ncbi:MAG: polysaccharide biosynthesis tyrosine autokinase, partial [Promethearchaeota archaeon]
IADAVEVGDIVVLDYAVVPLVKGRLFDILKLFAISGLLSLAMSMGYLVVRDYFDKSVRNPKELEESLQIPLLGTIPVIGDGKEIPDDLVEDKKMDSRLITSDYAPNIASESFRSIRTKLLMKNSNKSNTFIVASLNPGEGKSLNAANIAITFAQQKLSTILVDCDLRRGVLHHSFLSNKKPGLSDMLFGNSPLTLESLSGIIQGTHIPNLFLLSSGISVPNPSELLGGQRMIQILELLQNEFDTVIVDTPPIEFLPDALVLNNILHSLILITKYGKTNLNKLQDKLLEYPEIQKDILGIILNAHPDMIKQKYYSYSYYQY